MQYQSEVYWGVADVDEGAHWQEAEKKCPYGDDWRAKRFWDCSCEELVQAGAVNDVILGGATPGSTKIQTSNPL